MRIRWRQTTWVVLVPITTHIPSLMKIGHCVLIKETKVYLLMLTRNLLHQCIHTSVHLHAHTYRQRDKWKISRPSSIAGSPQNIILIYIPSLTRRAYAIEKCRWNAIEKGKLNTSRDRKNLNPFLPYIWRATLPLGKVVGLSFLRLGSGYYLFKGDWRISIFFSGHSLGKKSGSPYQSGKEKKSPTK